MERAKYAGSGHLNTTSEEVESLVCPSRFNSDECVEIMCRRARDGKGPRDRTKTSH